MKKIYHSKSILQRFRYTKIYRAPMWLYKRMCFKNLNPKKKIQVNMRMGHKIKLIPTEQYLKAVVYSGQYHDQSVFIVKNFIKENSTIIDIGANIGLYTCAYAQYFKKLNLNIFAIEAVKNNFDLMSENIKLNNFQNIKFHHTALGKEEGLLEFNLPSEDFTGNVVGSNVEKDSLGFEHKESVKMITLDQYAKENNITKCDFIKIDIEGAEFFTFLGGKNFINATRPVIQAEYNQEWSNNIGISLKDYLNFFHELDYISALEHKDHYQEISDPLNFTDEASLMDLLFIPKEKASKS